MNRVTLYLQISYTAASAARAHTTRGCVWARLRGSLRQTLDLELALAIFIAGIITPATMDEGASPARDKETPSDSTAAAAAEVVIRAKASTLLSLRARSH